MIRLLEQIAIWIWNRLHGRRQRSLKESASMTPIGFLVSEDQVTRRQVGLSQVRRTMHVAILGKTGSGKSSLLRLMAQADIRAGRGFLYFDQHGDATPFLLRSIAAEESRLRTELDEKLILIAPADREYSVGLNPLEQSEVSFVRVAEISQILRRRWGLDHFGARTDELLRNGLYVLAANGLTLLELAPLLTHPGFRASCLKKTPNAEVRQYFELRYDKASEPMQATMREPILNKISAFTADPSFRHIVGQSRSTFSISDAMDKGDWIIANLPKGELGEQSITLGSLLFTVARNGLFSRAKRNLFTIYVDEVQNFLAYDTGIETVLSEARKFGVSVVTANQFLGQYPDEVRAAILSVGTLLFFQLSPGDATQVAQALDGGKSLAERLKNLRHRHYVMKSGSDPWREAATPEVDDPKASFADLVKRASARRALSRTQVEQEISRRHSALIRSGDEVLDAWE
jgi:energy-coupling factor transporter ATP-binding protein EcfA2